MNLTELSSVARTGKNPEQAISCAGPEDKASDHRPKKRNRNGACGIGYGMRAECKRVNVNPTAQLFKHVQEGFTRLCRCFQSSLGCPETESLIGDPWELAC